MQQLHVEEAHPAPKWRATVPRPCSAIGWQLPGKHPPPACELGQILKAPEAGDCRLTHVLEAGSMLKDLSLSRAHQWLSQLA